MFIDITNKICFTSSKFEAGFLGFTKEAMRKQMGTEVNKTQIRIDISPTRDVVVVKSIRKCLSSF